MTVTFETVASEQVFLSVRVSMRKKDYNINLQNERYGKMEEKKKKLKFSSK